MSGRVVIDWFPESRARYRGGWVVVAVDVIPATTTAVTAVAAGGACYPAANLAAAREPAAGLERPLLDGDVPSEFDLDNSPAALSRRTDVERPAVLLSTTGTRLLAGVASCTAVHAACLRNLSAQVQRLVTGRHQPGGGRKGAACLRMGMLLGGRGRLGRRSAVPPAVGAVQDSPDELEAGALTGSRPMTLICRRVSPKVRSSMLACRIRGRFWRQEEGCKWA